MTEYWEDIKKVSDNFTFKDFLDEKLGYTTPISYNDWLELNHYSRLNSNSIAELYTFEREFASRSEDLSIRQIAERRLKEFRAVMFISETMASMPSSCH